MQKGYPGVSGYPLISGGALAGACLLRLVRLVFAREEDGVGRPEEGWEAGARAVRPMLLTTTYVAGIASLDFLICTFLYLAAMPFLLDCGAGAKGGRTPPMP